MPSPLEQLTPVWKAVAWVGFPISVAIVLLLILVGLIPAPALMRNHSDDIQAIRRALDTHTGNSTIADETQVRLLRQICRNTSITEFGKDRCDR